MNKFEFPPVSAYPTHLRMIREWADAHDDMPDGAFFALAEENGIGVDEWLELADFETNYGKEKR